MRVSRIDLASALLYAFKLEFLGQESIVISDAEYVRLRRRWFKWM